MGVGTSQELIPTSSLEAITLFWGLKGSNSMSVGCPRPQCQRTFLGRFHFPVSFQLRTPNLGESAIKVTYVGKWIQFCSQLEGKGRDVFFHPEKAVQRVVWQLWLRLSSGSAVTRYVPLAAGGDTTSADTTRTGRMST